MFLYSIKKIKVFCFCKYFGFSFVHVYYLPYLKQKFVYEVPSGSFTNYFMYYIKYTMYNFQFIIIINKFNKVV